MTLMTLILASLIMVAAGLKGTAGMTAALVIGSVVCTALSVSGAFITDLLGRWADGGNLGAGFAMLAGIVFIALAAQLFFLRPKTDNMLE